MKKIVISGLSKIINKRILIYGIILMLINGKATGQDKKWSLNDCIDRALHENITIKQGELSNNIGEVTLEQSKANLIPSLSASGSQGFNFGRTLDPHTNVYIAANSITNNFSVSSGYNLFTGFQTINTIRKNKLDLQAGTLDLEKSKKDITLNVTLAYLQVLFAFEQIENAKVQVESTQAQVDKTQILVNAGTLPVGNLYTVQSQLATDKYNLTNAENQLSISKVNLMQLMELPMDPSFDVIRPELANMVVDSIYSNNTDSIYVKALKIQPDIASAELKVASAETNLKISKSSIVPRLSLSTGLSTAYSNKGSNPFNEQLKDNMSESVRLNLSIPIFSQMQNSATIKKSKINIHSTELNAQNTRNQLRKNIEQAYNDMVAALHNYEAVRDQLVSTETSYNDSKRKYDLGMITATDFLIAKNNYSTAISNLTHAKYNYLFTSKILDFYIGKPIKL
jgi:outer membrane protein